MKITDFHDLDNYVTQPTYKATRTLIGGQIEKPTKHTSANKLQPIVCQPQIHNPAEHKHTHEKKNLQNVDSLKSGSGERKKKIHSHQLPQTPAELDVVLWLKANSGESYKLDTFHAYQPHKTFDQDRPKLCWYVQSNDSAVGYGRAFPTAARMNKYITKLRVWLHKCMLIS